MRMLSAQYFLLMKKKPKPTKQTKTQSKSAAIKAVLIKKVK